MACFCSGFIGTHLGRRWGLFITGITAIIGVLLQVTSANRATLIVGRFFAGGKLKSQVGIGLRSTVLVLM